MIWVTVLVLYFSILKLGIWAYVIYLHFADQGVREVNSKVPKIQFDTEHKVVVRTKKDIVRG
jgi:hypothetical protein